MKLTLRQLTDSMPALDRLAEEKPKSAKLAYRLGRLVESARSEVKTAEAARFKLIQQYYNEDPEGSGSYAIKDKSTLGEFNSQVEDLLSTEVEVWGDGFKVDDVDGQLTLSVSDYALLSWLIKDGDG